MFFLLAPPAGAVFVYLRSRNAAQMFEDGSPSKDTMRWLRKSFWLQLAVMYCIERGMAGYYYFYR